MSRDCYQALFLAQPTFGHGIRYKLLGPSERDQVMRKAAQVAGPDASPQAFGMAQMREGVKAMLVAVTAKGDLTSYDQLATEKWVDLDLEKLAGMSSGGDLSYDRLFTAKDDELLCSIYSRLHTASRDEVEQIVGKAQRVSMD